MGIATGFVGSQVALANTQNQLVQAFDGAMTCSAVAAVKAEEPHTEDKQLWANRAFAFGMMATRFFVDAKGEGLSHEQLNNYLNDYAHALLNLPAMEQAGFEEGCAQRYAEMDKFCEANPCAFAPPSEESGAEDSSE